MQKWYLCDIANTKVVTCVRCYKNVERECLARLVWRRCGKGVFLKEVMPKLGHEGKVELTLPKGGCTGRRNSVNKEGRYKKVQYRWCKDWPQLSHNLFELIFIMVGLHGLIHSFNKHLLSERLSYAKPSISHTG